MVSRIMHNGAYGIMLVCAIRCDSLFEANSREFNKDASIDILRPSNPELSSTGARTASGPLNELKLIAPTDHSFVTTTTPTLEWSSPRKSCEYEVIIRSRSRALELHTQVESRVRLRVSEPLPSGVWYWRVLETCLATRAVSTREQRFIVPAIDTNVDSYSGADLDLDDDGNDDLLSVNIAQAGTNRHCLISNILIHRVDDLETIGIDCAHLLSERLESDSTYLPQAEFTWNSADDSRGSMTLHHHDADRLSILSYSGNLIFRWQAPENCRIISAGDMSHEGFSDYLTVERDERPCDTQLLLGSQMMISSNTLHRFEISSSSIGSHCVPVGDLNGDRRADAICIAGPFASAVRRTGAIAAMSADFIPRQYELRRIEYQDGRVTATPTFSVTGTRRPRVADGGDLNGDGFEDLIVENFDQFRQKQEIVVVYGNVISASGFRSRQIYENAECLSEDAFGRTIQTVAQRRWQYQSVGWVNRVKYSRISALVIIEVTGNSRGNTRYRLRVVDEYGRVRWSHITSPDDRETPGGSVVFEMLDIDGNGFRDVVMLQKSCENRIIRSTVIRLDAGVSEHH